MLRCEINKNIVTQSVEIYLFDKTDYFTYMPDGDVKIHKREPLVGGLEPYLCFPYDVWDTLKEAFKNELDVEKIEGSGAHIKDLRWILSHFIDKDKK